MPEALSTSELIHLLHQVINFAQNNKFYNVYIYFAFLLLHFNLTSQMRKFFILENAKLSGRYQLS